MILLVIGMGSVLLSDVDAASLLRKSTRREWGGFMFTPRPTRFPDLLPHL